MTPDLPLIDKLANPSRYVRDWAKLAPTSAETSSEMKRRREEKSGARRIDEEARRLMTRDRTQDERYKNYLFDLGDEIRQLALQAKAEAGQPGNRAAREFETGHLMALNEVVSLMQQQATGFGIALTDLRLADIEPDRDLV